MKKIIGLLLAAAILACLLISCSETNGEVSPTETTNTIESKEPAESQKPVESEKPAESQKPVELEKPAESQKPVESEKPAESQKPVESEKPAESQKPVEPEKPTESQEPTESEKPSESIRPEIKEAIDSYEAFVDEYCAFMKKYDSSDLTMMGDYLKLVQKELEMTQKFEAMDEKDLNNAELKYYTEVSLRCSSKLINCANDMN